MTALLRIDHVSKAFGGVHALNDCTVEVDEGTITGLIGPNGSGKTTRSTSSPAMSMSTPVTCPWTTRRSRMRQRSAHLPGNRPDLPAHADLPAAHRHGKHACRCPPSRPQARAWTLSDSQSTRSGGRGGGPAACHGSLEFHWDRRVRDRPRWHPLPTDSASCWSFPMCLSPTLPLCFSTSRRRQPLTHDHISDRSER